MPKFTIKNEPFYDFYRDGVTQSMIQTFLQCPYQCKLNYVDGWTPRGKPDYFVFGDCVHFVFEKIYQQKHIPLENQINNHLNTWYEQNVESCGLPLEEIDNIVTKVKAVLEAYCMRYASDFSKDWKYVEYEFKVPYWLNDVKRIWLRGKIDLVKQTDKELVLYDTKTLSMWSKEDALIILPTDIQLNFYAYVLSMADNVSGLVYNVIKKPLHKKGKLSNEDYYKKIKAAYLEDLDKYFHREYIPFSSEQAQQWKEQQLDPILKQMKMWADSNYTWPGYYNPLALENKYGLTAYARMIVDDDEVGYYKRERPNRELSK